MPRAGIASVPAGIVFAGLTAGGCSVSIETPGMTDEAPHEAAGVVTPSLDLAAFDVVDLTQAFDDETIYWPTAPTTFELEELAFGQAEGGYFYSAYVLSTPEHGGTHIDAPVHFYEGGVDAASIPLERLMGPAVVVDIREQAVADPDYRLTAADVEAHEAEHGPIPAGSLVLLRTGWSERWPDPHAYLGDDTPGDASNLHFPSYGEEAARLLVEERGVVALGADVASIDYGASQDFPVHQMAGAAGVPGLENLTNLGRLPARGATIIALPMKISGGSGGPLRAVALIPRTGG